jgi:hypothetical protein
MTLRLGLDTRTYWLTGRQSQCDFDNSVSALEVSEVERACWWVNELVRGLLWFSPCELLLLEAGSWGSGIVREPTVPGTSAVGNRYRTTTDENTAEWEDSMRVIVNCRVCKLAIELEFLVVAICKWSINPIINSNFVHSHSYTLQYTENWSLIFIKINNRRQFNLSVPFIFFIRATK